MATEEEEEEEAKEMHLENYHGERSEEDDVRRPVSALELDDFVDDGSLPDLMSMAMAGMGVDVAQPYCWSTSQATDNSVLFSPLETGADPRDYLDWDQLPVVFQYPSNGGGSPGDSNCSEATTPTWSNAVTATTTTTTTTTDHGEDKSDGRKLPSMGSAFSFSRAFGSTIYPEYAAESQGDYQDYPDCHEDVVSLLMSIQNDVQNYSPSVTDEFDLSLIRGDPTSLLSTMDPPSSSSTICPTGDDQQEPFQSSFNTPYYAVGHLVSSQQQPSAVNLAGEFVGAIDSFGNQVILPRNEGLLLGNHRRVTAGLKVAETERNDKTYGKYATRCSHLF